MLFGLDGVEVGLIIVFLTLFAGILSGFPVAFAISGSAVISFAVIAAMDGGGLLTHFAVDTGTAEYAALIAEGVRPDSISVFRYPDLPRYATELFPQGWEKALDRNVGFLVNRMNERVLAGQSIETLLAVLMFVMMGIVLVRTFARRSGRVHRDRGCVSGGVHWDCWCNCCDHGPVGAADNVEKWLFAVAIDRRDRCFGHLGADHSAVDRNRSAWHIGGGFVFRRARGPRAASWLF
jgi:hypothetical protein